ncbi:phage antirepressor KilAC domain-containing protein [Mycolicibacterium fortuitum]|uniref:phage antirepressor KilAC domain-containing protein n=1 Tax=Mycolicibacterium fortuitum TaxID=1766 RepID=UPI0015E83AFD|nr:phage antirepressor KilAC domain-containing protein [Mycolicibacterium fortuitum]
MSEIDTTGRSFRFDDEIALTFTPDDVDGFHVPAPQVARALGYRQALDLTRSIPETEKGYELVRTPGGEQRMGYLTEAGFYRALGQRQAARIADTELRERVERFQSWVFGTVLPEIRRTGSYSPTPALTGSELLAHAVLEAQAMLAAKDEELAARAEVIAELEPKAEVADRILTAEGDLSVRDAAQSLTRAGIKVGQNRLFATLEKHYGWIGRSPADGRYRVKQTAIEAGYMSVIPQSHYHPKTGVLVLDPPQPRVTPKGLQRILVDHGGTE